MGVLGGGVFPPITPLPNIPRKEITMAKQKEEKDVVEATGASTTESDAKKAYRNLIEVYKAKNPAKYETKKAELQKKLDAIA